MSTNHCPVHRAYVKGCEPCRLRSNAYWRMRQAALQDGTWDNAWVTGPQLQQIRAHVQALLARPGMTNRAVAAAAGVSHSSVELMRGDRQRRCHPMTAQALAMTTPTMVLRRINNPRQLVSSLGTARRLQAMAVDEWSVRQIADLTGHDVDVVKKHRMAPTELITWGHHEIYRELYEKVQAQADPRGGSPRAGAIALQRGWVGSEQWEDGVLDDPDAVPLPPEPDGEDHVAIAKMVDDALRHPTPGKATDYDRSIKREIARQALGSQLGWSMDRVAELLGFSSTYSVEYLLRGRKDRKPPKERS